MSSRTRRRGVKAVVAAAAGFALVGGMAVLATPASAAEPRASFIVVLEPGQSPREVGREMEQRHGGRLAHVYEHALRGFSIEVPERAVAGISRDRRVDYVERDQVFATAGQTTPTGVGRAFAPDNSSLDIDQADDRRVDADIAIIDTGIDAAHPDLNVAPGGIDCTLGNWRTTTCQEGTSPDGNGHGTHVAGSAAALDNGFGVVGTAPGARLHGVKVLSDSGSGYTSWIIAGIDWVTANAATIEVANMSLGCECSSAAQDTAISNSVAAGVTYVVAAGNSDKDASTFSPAKHVDVITVSALADFNGAAGGGAAATCRADEDDTLANFSNFGTLVELAAPGVCIESTWPGGGYNTISGTSMASPHVAGAAGVLASSRPTATPADIRQLLVGTGNADWRDDSGDSSQEPLLDMSSSNYAAVTVETPAPVAVVAPSNLTATGQKAKSQQKVSLAWTAGTAGTVDIHRNGTRVATVPNSGGYSETVKGSGTFAYRVCIAGTSSCSNEASVRF